jgi:hypothetical protein
MVERVYRDSRINRIFEGTNEINRLLITGMLIKRAARGQLDLLPAAAALLNEIQSGKIGATEAGAPDEEMRLVRHAKSIALLTLGLAFQKYQAAIETQQEILMNLADIIMDAFAMESSLLRARKAAASGKAIIAGQMCAVFLRDVMARIESAARNVLGACCQGGVQGGVQADALRKNMSVLRRLAAYDPVDSVALRRAVAARLLAKERYSI